LKKAEGEVIVNCLRHQKVLEKAEALLKEALAASEQGFSSEYIAFGLWGAADTLGEILGLNYKENLLDAIFQEFCVGK
jgi:tRNA U34 5-carboxymethylaminomethyl modifying GTPase MnmE/TrmE